MLLTGWRFLLAAAVLPAPSGLCTVILETDFDTLCADADIVVVGTVTQVKSGTLPDRADIYTWTTFEIDEWIDGPGESSSVTIRTLGGTADGETLRVHGMPRFEVGRRYVLFLQKPRRTICPIVGWAQGCFHVERPAGAGAARVRTYDGRNVARIVDGKVVAHSDRIGKTLAESFMTLDEFVAEIRAGRARAAGRRDAKGRR